MSKSRISSLRDDIDREIVSPLAVRYNDLEPDALFCLWFVQWALSMGNINEARDSLMGGPGDHDIDAMYIDDKAVHVVQTKYREKPTRRGEKSGTVKTFASLAEHINGTKVEFEEFLRDEPMAKLTKERLRKAWNRTHASRPLRLKLYFV